MSVLEQFFGPGNDLDLDGVSEAAWAAIDPWLSRWREGIAPTFLPRTHAGRVYWYGLVDDQVQRRELQELLRHWLGPACSDVVQRQGALDPSDPFDRDLESRLPQRVLRIEVWPRIGETGPPEPARANVRERLQGLVARLDERPPRAARTAVSLPALLDELDLAATTADAQRALDLLEELQRRRLLDAPNTTFAEIRVKALLGRRDEVLHSDLLAPLDGLHVPPGIVLHVARALYDVHLRGPDSSADTEALLAKRDELLPVIRFVVRQAGGSTERAVNVARAVAVGDEPGVATLLAKALPDEPHLLALLGEGLATPTEEGSPTAPTETNVLDELTRLHHERAHRDVLDIALGTDRLPREAYELIVLSADELDSDSAAQDALVILERDLGPVEVIEWPTRVIQRTLDALRERLISGRPIIDGWEAWLTAVASGNYPPVAELPHLRDWAPLGEQRLLELIEPIEDPRPLTDALGALRAAHYEVLDVAARGALAAQALTVLALSDRSDSAIRAAAPELVADVLDAALSPSEAADLVEAAWTLIEAQLSIHTVTWAIDILSDLTGALALSLREELAAVWHSFFRLVRGFAASIRRARWLEVRSVIEQVDLELPADIMVALPTEEEEPDPLTCLSGKRVLLYSLRERSARQAAARMQAAGADVELSTAHGGSPQLAGQVEGADVVVIVTAAAKHAATIFIESHLATAPVRVNSAGMSSILMALEEVCAAA